MNRLDKLDDVDRLQAKSVMSHLLKLKRYGHRGQTSQEIIARLKGFISEPAIKKQIARLKKYKLIKEVKIALPDGNDLTIYEADETKYI